MSVLDEDIKLEALSALMGVRVKRYSEEISKNSGAQELTINNFVSGALLGFPLLYEVVEQVTSLLKSLFFGGTSENSSTSGGADVKELFVRESEFFDPQFDYDFTNTSDSGRCMRGNEPYKRPCGWMRIALKVRDKYPDGNTWLGPDGWRSESAEGEWPVSYHGTSTDGAKGIIQSHYKVGPRKLYGRGVYSTPDLDVARQFCTEFKSEKNGKTYRVIMQNRINPNRRKICKRADFWLIPVPEGTSSASERAIVESSIRPYGLLIKEM